MSDFNSPAPKYRHYRPKGLAVVRINGRDVYLGKYNSPESWVRYHREVAEHLETLLPSVDNRSAANPKSAAPVLSVKRLCLAYFEHADSYYRKNEKPTTEVHRLRSALRSLIQLYGSSPARSVRPKHLKRVRSKYIEAGLARGTINSHIHRIRRMFRWAVEEDLLPPSVVRRLACLRGLGKNRSAAREASPVVPVNDLSVEAALPFMPLPVQAMVRLQRLAGCRPGEICILRPIDVHRNGDVWMYKPATHKTEQHDIERRVYLGPRAQEVLLPWLEREPTAYCFSPAEAAARQLAAKHAARKTPLKYGNRPGSNRKANPMRKPKDCYTTASYRRAIERACERAKIAPWTPNRLRHTRATELRRLHGLDAAQVVLGHSDAFVTQIYAERDFARAEAVMRENG